MQIKVGTDIIEVERIKNSIVKHGEKFLNKIYTKDEIAYCNINADTKYQHFAVRFAAKEAVFKALSESGSDTLKWQDIEIKNAKSGRPEVVLYGQENDKILSIDISLSHVKETAITTVVAVLK